MKPIFFGPVERPLFGWLHAPEAEARVGVVICNPFGYEAICAHRTLRNLADALAAAGVPSIRFDYDGTGDSAGGDRDPDRVAAWVKSVHAAREALGTERVVLVGVRLGALIAAVAASERDDVEQLIAIAPVVSGRAHVRELKLLQGALGLTPAPVPDEENQEAVGFVLTAETRAALGKLDLAKIPLAPRVLILDRDDLPAGKLPESFEVRRMPGYVEMMLDPHKTVVPTAIISAVVQSVRPERARRVAPRESKGHVAPGVVETPVLCDGRVFGILSEPTANPSSLAILLLNAGAVHHVGPNRLWTVLARRWAALGHRILRADITGIGDSRPRAGADENVVYSPHALTDVAAALAHLRGLPGITDCRSVGLCSGAYYSFKAAVAGLALSRVVVVNPLTFFWHEGESLDTPAFKMVGDVERYQKNILRAESWKKVLRGEVDLRAAARTMRRYATTVVTARARDVARAVGRPMREDLGAELETVANHAIDLRFVFAVGDPGLGLLRAQSGSALPALLARKKLSITMIDGPDHTFTPVWTHAELIRVLDEAL